MSRKLRPGDGLQAFLALHPRHLEFARAYLEHRNATAAVLEVYGCTYASAKVQGCRLMRRKDIRAAIEYGSGNAELLAQVAARDALEAAIRLGKRSHAPTRHLLAAHKLVLTVAGALPEGSRSRAKRNRRA